MISDSYFKLYNFYNVIMLIVAGLSPRDISERYYVAMLFRGEC